MDYEPGPLALFTEEEIPVAGEPSTFEALAVDQVDALEGTATAMEGQLLVMSGAGDNELEAGAALELAAAADEHARQSHDSDSAIGGVAASADALEGELAGLSSELADDLKVSVPSEPAIPPDGYGPREQTPPPVSLGEWDELIRDAFRTQLRREATDAELAYARRYHPDFGAALEWVRHGAPMDGSAPPPSSPPPPSPDWPAWDAGVHALFRARSQRDAFDGELNYARRFYPDLEAVRVWIAAGTPYS